MVDSVAVMYAWSGSYLAVYRICQAVSTMNRFLIMGRGAPMIGAPRFCSTAMVSIFHCELFILIERLFKRD